MRSPILAQWLLIASVAAPLVIIVCCVAVPDVVRRPGYVAVYLAPAVGGFLLWLSYRLETSPRYCGLQDVLDGVVVLLCSLRMTAPLVPTSGHMLFFVYAAVTTPARPFRWVMAALIVETTYIKLVVWGDVASWASGTVAALILGQLYVRVRDRRRTVVSPPLS